MVSLEIPDLFFELIDINFFLAELLLELQDHPVLVEEFRLIFCQFRFEILNRFKVLVNCEFGLLEFVVLF